MPSVEALATLVYSKPLVQGRDRRVRDRDGARRAAGERVARGLYTRAAEELGKADRCGRRADRPDGRFPVGLIGSAFKAGELFVGPLADAVREFAPQAQVAVVEMAPVGGCVLLGRAPAAAGRRESVDPGELKPLLDAALAQEGVFRE